MDTLKNETRGFLIEKQELDRVRRVSHILKQIAELDLCEALSPYQARLVNSDLWQLSLGKQMEYMYLLMDDINHNAVAKVEPSKDVELAGHLGNGYIVTLYDEFGIPERMVTLVSSMDFEEPELDSHLQDFVYLQYVKTDGTKQTSRFDFVDGSSIEVCNYS